MASLLLQELVWRGFRFDGSCPSHFPWHLYRYCQDSPSDLTLLEIYRHANSFASIRHTVLFFTLVKILLKQILDWPSFEMPLRTVLLPSLLFGCSILHVSAIPVDPEPTAVQPRDSDSTAIPNWLDYAPGFSQDPFPPWPPITNPSGSNITTQNVRGTKLFGWKGCDSGAMNIIQESFKHFETLAGQKALYDDDIDWNSQAALDIWGHSTDDRKAVQDDRKLQIKRKSLVAV
jgi:hypothetical protein